MMVKKREDFIVRKHRAQSIAEYAMLVAAVAAACSAMLFYARRPAQGILKQVEDNINYGTYDDYLEDINND